MLYILQIKTESNFQTSNGEGRYHGTSLKLRIFSTWSYLFIFLGRFFCFTFSPKLNVIIQSVIFHYTYTFPAFIFSFFFNIFAMISGNNFCFPKCYFFKVWFLDFFLHLKCKLFLFFLIIIIIFNLFLHWVIYSCDLHFRVPMLKRLWLLLPCFITTLFLH